MCDRNSKLVHLENEHEEVTTFAYDPVGREILKELDNGTRTTFVYNAAGQILAVANLQANDDLISRFTYTYDPVGNRTQEAREDGDLRIWTYDPTNQLISEQRTEGESWSAFTADQWSGMGVNDWGMLPAVYSAGPITTYLYDPVGNRLILNIDGDLTTSTYDAANRLVTAEDISGITTYTFDANGNQRTVEMPTNDITTYSWTYENQLAQLEEPDDVVTTYVYAPTNRRGDELRLSTETDAGLVQFLWDDQNLIQELDDTGTVEAEYTLNPQAYGDLVSQRREGDSTFYHYDALGSTQSLTNDTGTVENEYTYSAFGKELSSSGSVDNPFTWVGELGYYKEADGRYTLRRREYEEAIARFLSEDPAWFDEENLYPYVRNNPTSLVDPSGRIPYGMIDFGPGSVGVYGGGASNSATPSGAVSSASTCSKCSTCETCNSSPDAPTIKATVYEETSLAYALSKILGPVHGPKFLETQGLASAQKIIALYAGGWRFKIGGLGRYSLYSIDPPNARIQVYDSLVGNEGAYDCPIDSDVSLSDLDIYKNLNRAIHHPEALPYYRGESQENWAFAGYAAFCGHPNTRVVIGAAEIVGSVWVIVGSGGTATPIVLLAAGYGTARGLDSLAGGVVELVTGEPIRDISSQVLDQITRNQDTTNAIITTLDIGVIIVDLGSAGVRYFKKSDRTQKIRDNFKRFLDDESGSLYFPLRYKLGPNDLDWRGTGRTVDEAISKAFELTGEVRTDFVVTRWGKDKWGKSFPVEWRSSDGAEVNIDWAHAKNGPDAPHVGWQTGGKKRSGGKKVGHILLDSVPCNR